jgi:hypothetical protein
MASCAILLDGIMFESLRLENMSYFVISDLSYTYLVREESCANENENTGAEIIEQMALQPFVAPPHNLLTSL